MIFLAALHDDKDKTRLKSNKDDLEKENQKGNELTHRRRML